MKSFLHVTYGYIYIRGPFRLLVGPTQPAFDWRVSLASGYSKNTWYVHVQSTPASKYLPSGLLQLDGAYTYMSVPTCYKNVCTLDNLHIALADKFVSICGPLAEANPAVRR